MFSSKSKTWAALFLLLVTGKAAMAESDARKTESPYGVLEFLPWDHEWNGHHYTPEKVERAVKLMKDAGVGIVRMDIIWNDVEPANDRWEFEKYDRILDLLSRSGIKVLALLNYNADWTGQNWNDAPDKKLYAAYVRKVVARYKDRIAYWEVWNEPNQDIYWVPQDRMEAYTAVLREAYPAIKQEDPAAVVLLGGLSGDCAASLADVYRHGGRRFFDVVNAHPFQDPHLPTAMERMKAQHAALREVMEKNGDGGKPIWFTELGCPGVPDGKSTQNWWLGDNPSEKTQAAWVETVYREPLRWKGVEKVFWAFFRDTPNHFLTGTDYFGLVREDFTPKPAFEAYKKLAKR